MTGTNADAIKDKGKKCEMVLTGWIRMAVGMDVDVAAWIS